MSETTRPPRPNPDAEAALKAWAELDGRHLEGYRVINDRELDGIDVKLHWKVDSEPTEFAVTVDDHKLNTIYPPLEADLGTYKDVWTHPMAKLAEIATKACNEQIKHKNFDLTGGELDGRGTN